MWTRNKKIGKWTWILRNCHGAWQGGRGVAFPCSSAGKEPPCNAGDLESIPGLGRSPGEGKDYPLQHPGLEKSMDFMVHGVAKHRTRLNNFHFTSLQSNCGDSVIMIEQEAWGDSFVRVILQARILEWVAISFSRGSSRPRDWTHISWVSCIAGGFCTAEPSAKLLLYKVMVARNGIRETCFS